jgi:FtsZ-interacting cell division protein ZipA
MNTSTTVWIVIVVVAIALIALLIFVISRATRQRRQRQAEEIREHARLEAAKLERRQALADETAAKARAAQAEAEVKAAEAARLQERAAKHQNDAATSREQLEEQWRRADEIDPEVRADNAPETGGGPALARDGADEWDKVPRRSTNGAADPAAEATVEPSSMSTDARAEAGHSSLTPTVETDRSHR